VIIRIQVGVSQDGHVLLQISDLVVEVDKFLSLLLNEKWSVSNIELHDSFLLVVYILKILHLVLGSLETIVALFLQLKSIV